MRRTNGGTAVGCSRNHHLGCTTIPAHPSTHPAGLAPRARRAARAGMGVVVVAMAVAAATGPVAAQPDDEPRGSLAEERDQLAADEAELARVQQRIAEAEAQVRASEQALASAAAELEVLATRVADAEAVVVAATGEHEKALRDQIAAHERLDRAERVAEQRQDDLDAQAATLYKHSTEQQHALSLGSVLRATSPHDAIVALRAARRTTQDRDTAAVRATQARDAAEQAHVASEVARGDAATALARAEEAEARVVVLRAEQQGVVERLANVRAAAQQALEALDDDREVIEALVARRRERVAQLQAAVDAALAEGSSDLSWAARLPAPGRRWAPSIADAAADADLDARLLAALVWTESGFVPDAVSHAGATGLAQLMPGTARGLGVDPRDPEQNLRGGARYLRAQVDRFGSVELGLAAYNAGPGRVVEAGNRVPPIAETQLYVPRVLERFTRLAG